MREIKFRGKRLDNGEWVFGDFIRHYENQRRFIACDQLAYTYTECGISRLVSEHFCEVDTATVGQYTGLKDKDGREIYEGDIVNCWGGECCQGYWEFNDTIAVNDIRDYVISGILGESEYIDVIGNVYDNPELLEEKK